MTDDPNRPPPTKKALSERWHKRISDMTDAEFRRLVDAMTAAVDGTADIVDFDDDSKEDSQ